MKLNMQQSRMMPAISGRNMATIVRFLQRTLWALLAVSVIGILWGLFVADFSSAVFDRLLGLTLLAVTFSVALGIESRFYSSRIKEPPLPASLDKVMERPERYNLADFFAFEPAVALWKTTRAAHGRRAPATSTELLRALLSGETASFLFYRLDLRADSVDSGAAEFLENHPPKMDVDNPQWSEHLQTVIMDALSAAAEAGKERIEATDVWAALGQHDPYFHRLLIDREIPTEDVANLARLKDRIDHRQEVRSRFWSRRNLSLWKPLGRDLAAGYTITLDQYGRDITQKAIRGSFHEVIGHQSEFEEVQRVLSRSENNNALVVGRPGSGRSYLVEHFARESYFGRLSENLNHKRVVELDLPALVAQIEDVERAEQVLDRIFTEISTAGNVVLVVKRFHEYISRSERPGVLNISGLLASYLAEAEFQIIAITSYAGLHTNIEKNPSILNYFNKIEVGELTEEETLRVLENWMPYFETHHKKVVTYAALKETVQLASQYMTGTASPKNAIDLLDETMVYAANQPRNTYVTPGDVDTVVTERTEVPVGKIQQKEKEVLRNLEDLLHERIINQNEAVGDVSEALRRARTQVTVREGPMGTFLFLGPTGVGKTETSKALAAIYFGSEERMIRVDMSEFQSVDDITRLIGSEEQDGVLTTAVREDPFSLVLLDEIEKAHPNILNLFLQVLDEGFVTDGMGRTVNFKNTIIIGTSNAGADVIWDKVQEEKGAELIKEDLFERFFENNTFRPEFLNRFDSVVIFKPLSTEHLVEIADLMFREIQENMQNKEIELVVPPPVKKRVAELGYDPAFGAREMRRVLQEKVENELANALLEDRIQRGDKVKLQVKGTEEFEVIPLKQPALTA